MRKILSDTQGAFYVKNGFIEFEIPPYIPNFSTKRDQWREDEKLKSFILKVLGPIALVLTGKKKLKLALSEWIVQANRPSKASPLKEICSFQNLALAISIAPNPLIPSKKSPLGILPLPTSSEQILFFKPELILDWPHVGSDLFLILLSWSNGVYIHNPNDPQTSYLKKLGLEYGDSLKPETHPLILNF